jgi:DNA-binding transcriptional regulator YhcF (GntR family)
MRPGGRAGSGHRFTGRQADIGVNVHTVLRAYGSLRDAGLIELRPRRGAVVSATSPPRQQLAAMARGLIEQAREHGLSPGEIVDLITGEL